jgi:para-aminobenzoate synthetase/4-amino-4-deoxychorismate lyase
MSASVPALFETMRAEDGVIPRLDLHLARLLASSRAFGISFDPNRARLELKTAVGEGLERVRLILHPTGELEIGVEPLSDIPFRTAWMCRDPMPEAGTLLCQHKTANREHYERRWRAARARGADEAIVVNPAGEVVEGTRTSVWVKRKGKLWTPPLASGGLPGVERAHLLATHSHAGESVLLPEDLELADAVFLSNALRGLMQVVLVGGDGEGQGE